MKAGLVVGGAVAAALLAGGAWLGRDLLTGGTADGAPMRFVTPERRTVAASVLATGILRLKVGAEVRVGSQLSGIVEQLNVEVGSRIREGDVIARIDSRGLEARLAQARAQVAVIEQEVRRAEVELERARQLDSERLVARSEVEDRQLALDEARARLVKARRDADVVATDLSYSVLRAPITGTVASVSTQEGETVAAAFTTPTFATIIEDGALELIAMVDETDIGSVAVGNPVSFTVEAWPTEEFTGRVERIAPKGTIISGVVNFEVMVSIDREELGEDGRPRADMLKPDMTANVSIRTAEREALVVPSEAIRRDGFERFVIVDADGDLRRRAITPGTRSAGVTEIREGLKPGERVLLGPAPEGLGPDDTGDT